MKAVPIRIPNQWDADWYRRHYVEVLSQQIQAGIDEALSGATGTSSAELALHNADDVANPAAFAAHDERLDAHARAFDVHRAETDPHPDLIDDLEAVTAVAEADYVLVSQGGTNKKATVDQLAAAVFGEDWTDLRFPAQGINPAGAAAPPTVITSTSGYSGCLEFAGNAENLIAGVAQMPHEWKRGSAIKPHIHWTKPTGSANAVTWEFYYRHIGNPGDTVAAWSAAQAGTIVAGDQTVSNQHLITSFPDIDMTGFIESAMILWRIHRQGGTDADNSAVVLYEFDIHYQSDKAGTETAIPTE